MEPRLRRLLDKQEIQEVVHSYCRGIDRRDLDLVRRAYHPDATDQHGSFDGSVDEYIEWVDRLLDRYRFTMHFIGNVLVDFGDDPDRAVAESYGVALHRSDESAASLNLATGFRYLDRFERRAGEFRIAARIAVTEWSLAIPPSAWWAVPDSLLQGRRDRGDALYGLLEGLASSDSALGPAHRNKD